MTASEIVKKYIKFFEERGHKEIVNSSLVPENDPTTLFTSSGMQPLVPYLLGEVHPQGKRLVNSQDSFRSQDIEEIGDNRHTTFFRMLGNWSLGDPARNASQNDAGGYFKKEQLPWFFEFLTGGLGIDPRKLYVTCFEGYGDIAKDTQSEEIWKELFKSKNIDPQDRIFFYGPDKNWWSRSGVPDNMPIGEPGGPDSEVFYDFCDPKIHEQSAFKDKPCHPNCDCGRYMEIGNSVFMEFIKSKNGFDELPQKNVDFGGGLERLLAAVRNEQDVFKTGLYWPIIKIIEEYSRSKYEGENKASMRVIADHLKASVFMILAGVKPSNKEQGYVLRRLLRRSAVKMHSLRGGLTPIPGFEAICDEVLRIEEEVEPDKVNKFKDRENVFSIIGDEMDRFGKSLDKGLKIIEKAEKLTGKEAFDLYQSYGFPVEITIELMSKKSQSINIDEFKKEFEKHKELSRTASSGMFKGGLADSDEEVVMGHTATHLLHRALKDVLGEKVNQAGSNITNERVRFDFNYDRRLTEEQIKRIEKTVNDKIKDNLKVDFTIMPLAKAKEKGAVGLFNEKYQDEVKVYTIGPESGLTNRSPRVLMQAYSHEICGGPHVDFTGKLKRFKIIKQENIGHGLKRLYAKVG